MKSSRRVKLAVAAMLALGAGAGQAQAQTATVTGNWTQQNPAMSPPARYASTMTYDAVTGQVVLFGGTANGAAGLADTWTYNGTTWTQQSPATSPPGRFGSTMAYDAVTGQVVLFGGADVCCSSYLGDTWTYNGTTWTQQNNAGPSVRDYSTMGYDAVTGQVVLFGGSNNNNGTSTLGDTWTYNGMTWTQQSPATSPRSREFSATAHDPATGQVMLFGGASPSVDLGDTWTYNGTTWTQQSPATSPPIRQYPTMAYDAATGQVVLFGGFGNPGGFLADTWTYNGTTWTQQSPVTSPPAREYSTMAYNAATGQVVLFGGVASGFSTLGDTWTYQVGAADTPTSPVGTAAAQTPVYFLIGTGGTLPALSNSNVLTQGAGGLDFTLGTGSTCTGAVAAGQTCTVNVAFTPKYPGQRLGAVELTNSSGTTLATALISGIGTGPQVAIYPGTITNPVSGLSDAFGIAADASGALYVATVGSNSVIKFTPSGSTYTQTTLPVGGQANQLAVDGGGNIYVTTSAGLLKETLSPGAGTYSQSTLSSSLTALAGVAVDASGNLYVAYGASLYLLAPNASGGYTQSTLATGLNNAVNLTVDASGNLYVNDAGAGAVYKYTNSGGTYTQSTIATGLSNNNGIAVDASGILYVVANGTTSGILRYVPSGSTYAALPAVDAGTIPRTNGIALDGKGNLYISSDSTAPIGVFKVDVSDPSTLNFASTAVGATSSAQNVTLENDGNASLSFGLIQASNASFGFAGGVASGSTPGCGGPVAAGALCNAQATFKPQTTGALTANGVVTDNSLNVSNATQTVVLTGTGTSPFTVTGVSPGYGPAAGGTTVTITGTGLNNVTQVTFGGVAATSFTLGSGTQMTAVAPAGTGTVDIIVGSATYVSAATTADQFSYVGTYTVTVNTDTTTGVAANCFAGGTNCSLRDAIAATNAAGFTGTTGAQPTIKFALGQGAQTITLNSPALKSTANVNIAGPGAALLTIVPATTNYTYNAFTSTTNSLAFTLSGVTVTGFGVVGSTMGAALYFSPSSASLATGDLITLNNDTFSNDGGTPGGTTASSTGGALSVSYSTLAVAGSTFTGNSASQGGAIYATFTNVAITGSTFGTQTTPNRALTGVGGALYLSATLTYTATIGTSTFAYNTSKANGAGVYAVNLPLTLNTDVFLNNASSSGGGAVYTTGALTVAGSTFNNNTATANGGAIYVLGLLTVSGSSFTANQAGNTASNNGGAIYSTSNGANSISSTNFLANRVITTGFSAYGGALYAAVANLTNVLFSGNYISSATNSFGGAAYYNATASSQLTGVTFTGNSTQTGSTGATNQLGGALYVAGPYVMHMYNSTISGNSAKLGGGVVNSGSSGTIQFYNSVASGNSGSTGYPDFDNANNGGYYTDGSDYVDPAATCSTFCTPLLSALGNYGGGTVGAPGYTTPVQVMLPLPGSPLLAAGSTAFLYNATTNPNVGTVTCNGVATEPDARGCSYPRTLTEASSTHVDIGAAEASYSLAFVQQPGIVETGQPQGSTVQLSESGNAFAPGVAGGILQLADSAGYATPLSAAVPASGLVALTETYSTASTGDTLTATVQSSASTPVVVASATSGAYTIISSATATFAGLKLSAFPANSVTGLPQTVTVTALDNSGATYGAYAGTVTFTSTDAIASLPAAYTFTAADAGSHTFTITLNTGGTQGLTVTENTAAKTATQSGIVTSGYVWLVNPGGSLTKEYANGTSIGNFTGGGTPMNGLAFDPASNAWSLDRTNSLLVEFTQAGTALSGSGFTGGGLSTPAQLAIDGAGQVWITNTTGSLSLFSNTGTALSPASGLTGVTTSSSGGTTGYTTPTGIAIDISGNVWVANSTTNTVTEILGGAAPTAPLSTAVATSTPATHP